MELTNWAGNLRFGASALHRPATIAGLQRLVAASRRVRAVGTGHSFSPIADTPGDLISVASLPLVIEIDSVRMSAMVSAGTSYADLAPVLHRRGFALASLASLPHISVAGATATATHGSGDGIGNLATAVSGFDLVTAPGDLVTMTRAADDEFAGAVVGLGALGVLTSLTLDLVPSFELRQYVYDDVPLATAVANLGEIFASGYSVSLFTGWRRPLTSQIWLKRLAGEPEQAAVDPRWLGGKLADGPRHPVPGLPAAGTTGQLGVAGPWHERLPHFMPDSIPSAGSELQSEYLVPREHARDALLAVAAIGDVLAPVVQVCEIRTVAGDDLWLRPSSRRDSIAVHFTWIADTAAVTGMLALVERQLAAYQPRPHWGKLFTASADVVRGRYERIGDFAALMQRLDPAGKFGNDFTARYLAGSGP